MIRELPIELSFNLKRAIPFGFLSLSNQVSKKASGIEHASGSGFGILIWNINQFNFIMISPLLFE